MNVKDKKLTTNNTNYNSSYKRTNEAVRKEKTVHCIDALEDIIDTLLNKHYIKMEYYHTDHVVMLKFDSTSYRLSMPILNDDIVHLIKDVASTKKINKDNLLEHVLKTTDVANIAREHCLNCYKISKCKVYEKYLTL